MDDIWDGGPSHTFRVDFQDWATSHDGDIQEGARTALFCELPSTNKRSHVRMGIYEANGQKMLRFDTIREEIEIKLIEKYETTEDRLIATSEKGSRTFEYNAKTGEWTLEKAPP